MEKKDILIANGTYNTRYHAVKKKEFQVGSFYDPMDIVQVKYEMLRELQESREAVGAVALEFGFSRTSYYTIKENFEASGITSLIPEKKGPKEQHKLTKSLREFTDEYILNNPKASAAEITEVLVNEKCIEISKRTIERYKSSKKTH